MQVQLSKAFVVGGEKLSKTIVVKEAVAAEGDSPAAPAETAEVIELDLEKLTGEHLLKAETLARGASGGMPSLANVLDGQWQIHVAEQACGIKAAALRKLPAVDFMKVTSAVQGFFMGSD